MGGLRNVAIAVLVLSFFVFVAFFGRLPALRATPIGFLHRCIWIRLPKAAREIDSAVTGGRVTSHGSRLAEYLFYEKHPIILIFFLTLLTSASAFFLYSAWARIPFNPHHILIPLILPTPYIFTYLCVTTTSHLITPSNHSQHLTTYPYDHTLYKPATTCSTCHFTKPARSKHCSLCGHCVARADHHCAWVNNCLGSTNYKWFVALLASLSILLFYGALLSYKLVGASYEVANVDRGAVQRGWIASRAASLNVWYRAMQLDFNVAAVGLLAGLTAPLAFCLFLYHVYLAWAGMTTNETGKWADLKADADDGVLWMRRRQIREPRAVDFQNGRALSPFYGHEKAHGGLLSTDCTNNRAALWKVSTDQAVVMCEEVPADDERDGEYADDGWRQCRSLDELNNIYDRGLWLNIQDAFNIG